MGWVGRLFDARDTIFRLILLVLSGLGYLLLPPHPATPGTLQWVLAIGAFAGVLLFHRRLIPGLIVQAVLLIVAYALLEDPTINQVGTSWMLLEVAMAAPRLKQVWWCSGLVVTASFTDAIPDPVGEWRPTLFGLAVEVGLPLLFGLVIRTTRELARQAQERVAEEQLRHESENRAARSAERTAIARELHDVVAHHVASMVLRVGVARHVLPGLDPRAGEVFDDVHATGSAALADLRRLVAVLRDPDAVRDDAALTAIDPSALPAALDGAVENARRAGVLVDAEVAPEAGSLDAVRGAAVLRLTQEALTNVAKHARPGARATLSISVVAGDVHWEVEDDGGDPSQPREALPPGGGHGLTGMRERVEVLGGELTAGPHGSGWRVHTVLPALPSDSAVPSAVPAPAPPPPAPAAPPPATPAPPAPAAPAQPPSTARTTTPESQ